MGTGDHPLRFAGERLCRRREQSTYLKSRRLNNGSLPSLLHSNGFALRTGVGKNDMKVNLRILTALACVAIVGSSFAQQGGGRRQRGGGGQMTLSRVVQRPDVQADLALTDDEKTKLEALVPARGQGGGGRRGGGGAAGGGGGQGAPDPGAMAARRKEEKDKIAAILTPDQMKRLSEIYIQLQGDMAVTDPDVQTAIGFDDAQKAKLKDLTAQYRDATRQLREKAQSDNLDRAAVREATQKNQKTYSDEIHKILTDSQISKLKDLGGKPFTAAPAR